MPPNNNHFDLEVEKKLLLDKLTYFKSLVVNEYTFRKSLKNCTKKKIEQERHLVDNAYRLIWEPRGHKDRMNIKQIEQLHPGIVFADDDELINLWKLFRQYAHSGKSTPTPGYQIKFFVIDKAGYRKWEPKYEKK